MRKSKYPRLSFEQIEKVIAGDTEAMNTLITLYMPYINALSNGNTEIEDMVITKLMSAAIRFNIDYQG